MTDSPSNPQQIRTMVDAFKVSQETIRDLMGLIRGYQRSRALMVAVELGIADLLREGPRSVEDLAAATETHTPTLYRLLRALSAAGVFEESVERSFSLTPLSEFLRSDAALPYGNLVRFFGRDYQWSAWGALLHSVQTGDNAATHVLGKDVWAYREEHPEENAIFNDAMLTATRSSAALEVGSYDFTGSETVVDIAGGTGSLLAVILQKNAHLRGVLFDQAHVVADAEPVLEKAGVAGRVDVEAGSFFEKVPAGHDVYVMRRILHDWMDEEAIAILRCCRAAMKPEARLLLIESIVGPPNEDPDSKFFDLLMLVSAGGRERTEVEWKQLLEASGFRMDDVRHASPSSYVIVAAPA